MKEIKIKIEKDKNLTMKDHGSKLFKLGLVVDHEVRDQSGKFAERRLMPGEMRFVAISLEELLGSDRQQYRMSHILFPFEHRLSGLEPPLRLCLWQEMRALFKCPDAYEDLARQGFYIAVKQNRPPGIRGKSAVFEIHLSNGSNKSRFRLSYVRTLLEKQLREVLSRKSDLWLYRYADVPKVG